MSNVTNSERMLNVTFVQSDFFVDRIHYFEDKYGMQWGQFLAQYSTGALEAEGCSNTDFAEWAFLCNSFMSELLKPNEAGPPATESNSERQKPERDSGFLILGRHFVRRASPFRAHREGASN